MSLSVQPAIGNRIIPGLCSRSSTNQSKIESADTFKTVKNNPSFQRGSYINYENPILNGLKTLLAVTLDASLIAGIIGAIVYAASRSIS